MKLYTTYFFITILALLGACTKESTETIQDVAYWKDPANKAAFDAKLAECKNNPAEMSANADCINVMEAKSQKFRTKLFN